MEICETTADDDTELDISWLEEEEKLLDESNYRTQPLSQIRVVFFYLDKTKKEVRHETVLADLELSPQTNYSKMGKDVLYSLIQSHKGEYKLFDIQYFHLHLGEDNIQAFSTAQPDIQSSAKLLKGGSVLKDLVFEPSIALFHDLSEILVFFMEEDRPSAISLKSILKQQSPHSPQKSIQTKKVRILMSSTPVSASLKTNTKRTTRKHRQ